MTDQLVNKQVDFKSTHSFFAWLQSHMRYEQLIKYGINSKMKFSRLWLWCKKSNLFDASCTVVYQWRYRDKQSSPCRCLEPWWWTTSREDKSCSDFSVAVDVEGRLFCLVGLALLPSEFWREVAPRILKACLVLLRSPKLQLFGTLLGLSSRLGSMLGDRRKGWTLPRPPGTPEPTPGATPGPTVGTTRDREEIQVKDGAYQDHDQCIC